MWIKRNDLCIIPSTKHTLSKLSTTVAAVAVISQDPQLRALGMVSSGGGGSGLWPWLSVV